MLLRSPTRRVKARLRDDRREAARPNGTRAMGFVHGPFATGRKIRALIAVDTFSRHVPAIDPRFSHRGEDIVQVLEKVCSGIGCPTAIRVDQGTELVSRSLDRWADTRGIALAVPRASPAVTPGRHGCSAAPASHDRYRGREPSRHGNNAPVNDPGAAAGGSAAWHRTSSASLQDRNQPPPAVDLVCF